MDILKEMLFLLTWLFILFAQLTEEFTFVSTMSVFIKFRGRFMYNISNSGSFHGQDYFIIKLHFH